jgi:hypothetical protein
MSDIRIAASLEARITGLWRYPVQSLRGEALHEIDVTATGIRGDRGYGIADVTTGSVVGSSRPGWDALITWSARYLAPVVADAALPPVEISFPDGETIRSDNPDVDRLLSARLGKGVRLVVNDGSQAKRRYNLAPCHFLTTATLKKLRDIYPEGTFDPARFRPNLLLDCGDVIGFIEQDWHSRHLNSDDAALTVTDDCVRCAQTVRAQGDLPKDPRILHTITQHNRTLAGGYATVTKAGRLGLASMMTIEP